MEPRVLDGQRERQGLLVRRLIDQGIRDPAVLAAFVRVPRWRFVPPMLHQDAEDDRALDIGYGQTISQPFVVARMTEALGLRGGERILEVGTGSGYQTAILAEMEPARVYSIEYIEILAERARSTLHELGYQTVEIRTGDGALGWPEAAPFDAILVAAAPPEVPPALLDQLAVGGRLVIPVGPTAGYQELELWTRTSPRELERRSLFAVRFVPLVGRGGGGVH
jgi:protein-L-isoaspartate(D-aspartate) O-methyltransferase